MAGVHRSPFCGLKAELHLSSLAEFGTPAWMRNLCWLSHYFSEKSHETPENHGQFRTIWHPTHVYIASNLGCQRHISGWRNLLRKIPVRKMLMSKTCAISFITLAI